MIRRGRLSCSSHILVIITLAMASIAASAATSSTGILTNFSSNRFVHPSEIEAFFNVLYSLNGEVEWRLLYPDPCGLNAPQGTECEEKDGYYYRFTKLSFGLVYDNTPACSANATLHRDISKLAHLRSLYFYKCFSKREEIISAQLAWLPGSLETLAYRSNGALTGSISVELGNLCMLKRLIITENTIEGPIPLEIANLSNLLQLDLSYNRLGGVIPSSIGQLRRLIVLDLSNNFLNGTIPTSMGGLHSLHKMDLSRNSLQGAIPDVWGEMKQLSLLDLSSNSLQGNLPSSLFRLQGLKELYLQENAFNEPLPADNWVDMSSLVTLDLSSCGIPGPIPTQLGLLFNLRMINLSNNSFTGGVPTEIGNLVNLYALYIDGNSLSGHLPFSSTFIRQLGPNLHLAGNLGLCLNATLQWHVDTLPQGIGFCSCRASSSALLQAPFLAFMLLWAVLLKIF